MSTKDTGGGIERRDFLRVAAAAAAAGAIDPASLAASEPALVATILEQQQQGPPPVPLGQGEHPAVVFQAIPAEQARSWRSCGVSTDPRCSSVRRSTFRLGPGRSRATKRT